MPGPSQDRPYESREGLIAQIAALSDELDRLRERISSHPHDLAMLERRLADARAEARTTSANNERLASTLREAQTVRRRVLGQEARVLRAFHPDPDSMLDPRRGRHARDRSYRFGG